MNLEEKEVFFLHIDAKTGKFEIDEINPEEAKSKSRLSSIEKENKSFYSLELDRDNNDLIINSPD